MAILDRIRCTWTGTGVIGPAVTTFYGDLATALALSDLVTFFNGCAAFIPIGTTVTVPSSGDRIDDATGDLAGVWADAGGGAVVGSGSGSFALGVGARIVWNTAGTFGGRRVRGSSFIVPLVTAAYDGPGALTATAVTQLQNSASALVTAAAPGLLVWSRPKLTVPGESNAVTSATTPDRVSWLRSRRI